MCFIVNETIDGVPGCFLPLPVTHTCMQCNDRIGLDLIGSFLEQRPAREVMWREREREMIEKKWRKRSGKGCNGIARRICPFRTGFQTLNVQVIPLVCFCTPPLSKPQELFATVLSMFMFVMSTQYDLSLYYERSVFFFLVKFQTKKKDQCDGARPAWNVANLLRFKRI